MKYPHAWAATASQNVALKFALAALAIVAIVLAVCTARLAIRDPLIVERACFSRTVTPASAQRTELEVIAFVREAIVARFNTESPDNTSLLSESERVARSIEQKELSLKGMSQRVLVNAVKVDGNTVSVDTDRLISVGQIRSAFVFPLVLTVQTEMRTEANPYGLTLIKSEAVQPKGEKHEQ